MLSIDVTEAGFFYISTLDKGWNKVTGHAMRVGDFNFFATPLGEKGIYTWRVCEYESGALVLEDISPGWVEVQDQVLAYLSTVVAMKLISMLDTLKGKGDYYLFKQAIDRARIQALETNGPKPN